MPIFSESIFLIRVLAAYPPRLLSPLLRARLYGPIGAMKVTARLVNIIIYNVQWITRLIQADDSANLIQVGQTEWSGPFIKLDWSLTLVR